MATNSIILPPSFIVQSQTPSTKDKERNERERAAIDTVKQLFDARGNVSRDTLAFGTTLETYLRRMVAQCAVNVKLTHVRPFLRSARDTRALLSPSIRKRVSLVDQRKALWKAVKTYLQPVCDDLKKAPSYTHAHGDIDLVAWQLYLICLASKHSAEAPVSVGAALDNIRILETTTSARFSLESRARLSLVAGLFGMFSSPMQVPSLQLYPRIGASAIRDRIDEILEDAYLLEASRLRRFLGIRQNLTSVRRDLRLALSTIQKHSQWAKGILRVGASFLGAPSSSSEVTDKLADVIANPGILTPCVLSDEEWNVPGSQHTIVAAREGIFWHNSYILSAQYKYPGEPRSKSHLACSIHVHTWGEE